MMQAVRNYCGVVVILVWGLAPFYWMVVTTVPTVWRPRLDRHLPRTNHPQHLLRTPPHHLHTGLLLPAAALGAGGSRACRRRDPRPSIPPCAPATRRTGAVHHGDPSVHCHLERIHAGQAAIQQCHRTRHRGHRTFLRSQRLRVSLRRHHGRWHAGNHPIGDHGASVPASHRRRTYRRRRESLNMADHNNHRPGERQRRKLM